MPLPAALRWLEASTGSAKELVASPLLMCICGLVSFFLAFRILGNKGNKAAGRSHFALLSSYNVLHQGWTT